MPTFEEVSKAVNGNLVATLASCFVLIAFVTVGAVLKRGIASIIHGDGDGSPSLTGIAQGMGTIIAGQADHEARLTAVEAEQKRQGTEQTRQGAVLDAVQANGCQQLAAHKAALAAGGE